VFNSSQVVPIRAVLTINKSDLKDVLSPEVSICLESHKALLAVRFFVSHIPFKLENPQLNYGICLQNGKGVSIDMRRAVHYRNLAADQGDAGVQFNYGNCLHSAERVSIDTRNGAYYFKLTADQGDAGAQFNYRNCLQNGKGFLIHMRRAAHYFKLAADQGLAEAECHYG
jgi:hypothetical protein